MRVLVLGSGVIGTSVAYYLARAGHEVTVVDRQPGAGAGDELRQRRRGLARLFRAVGRAGRSAEGDQVAVHAARPLVIQPMLDPAMWRWGLQMLAQLHRRPLRGQQGAHGAAGRIQPRLPDGRCATRPASATTSARRARCSCSAPQKQLDGVGKDIEVLQADGVPFEVLDRDGCVAVEPGLAERAGQVRRRAAPAGRRDRRLLQVHPARWPRWRSGLGVTFRFGVDIQRLETARRRASPACTPTQGC